MDGGGLAFVWWLVAVSGFVLTGLSLLLLPVAWRDLKRFAPDQRRPAKILVGCYLLLAVSPFLPAVLFAARGLPMSWSDVLIMINLAVPIMLAAFAAVLGASVKVGRLPHPPGPRAASPECGQTLLWLTPLWTILLTIGSLFGLESWPVPASSVVGTWEAGSFETTTQSNGHMARRVVLHADGTVTGEESGGWRTPRPLQGRYTYDPAKRQLLLDVPGLEVDSRVTRDPFGDFHLTMFVEEDITLVRQPR